MSHKNYTRYSKMNAEEPMLVNEPVVEVRVEPAVEIENAIIEEPIEGQTVMPEIEVRIESEEPVAEPELPVVEPEIRKIGKVSGCKKLNVRRLPNADAGVVAEIVEGAEVMIDENESTALFHKVCTECGIEGYCIKKFIKVLA